jgi:Arc/MetJ-type ribon-helix-helix transcriptional regulator
MSNPNVTLRVSGSLRRHLEECTGLGGSYETPSEYLRDLIRQDMNRKESEKWERLRTALAEGLSAADTDYKSLSSADIKQRARRRHGLSS